MITESSKFYLAEKYMFVKEPKVLVFVCLGGCYQ